MADFDRRQRVRNICILAHVDHGKTTLADHLISSCGSEVHPKQAGKVRYMDFLAEEQRRAITMKSSSISLRYRDHFINLIDSPGHMDFCSEVSTAARLSDGALVLVDAVEGVHIQTHAVLRQAWIEKLTPCLVLNKIDRLITELGLSELEAYNRLLRIVHEVNLIVSAYKSQKYLSDVDSLLSSAGGGGGDHEEPVEDDEDTFQPQKGNVAFVCALDGWGFRIGQFAEFWASRIPRLSRDALVRGLWGPRYYNPETKLIVNKRGIEGLNKPPPPMFVQFVLEPLWKAMKSKGSKIESIIKAFNLSVPARDLQNKDPKVVLHAVMARWLPLYDAVLSMVVDCMPDPVSAQAFRIARLLPNTEDASNRDEAIEEVKHVRKCVEVCDSSPAAPGVAFVSKMFAVSLKDIPDHRSGDEVGESDECFLAFARIFSGVFNVGQRVFVLSALYDPLKPESTTQKHLQEAELQSIYLMMGPKLKPVASAEAGNIVAIRGLGQHILKSATLSSTKSCPPFSSMAFQVAPTLRVAIEPSDPADMGALMKGLRLLNRADPFVEVTVSSRGEHVLAAAGEVHLERCVKDLKDRFAKVSLEVSPPLVSYKETIEGDDLDPLENMKVLSSNAVLDCIEKTTPNGRCVVRVRVMKLPDSLAKVLDESGELLGEIVEAKSGKRIRGVEGDDPVSVLKKRVMDAIESEIEHASKDIADKDRLEKYRSLWLRFLGRIWALGPGQVGPNVLLKPVISGGGGGDVGVLVRGSSHVSERLGFLGVAETNAPPVNQEAESLGSSIVSGFQLATAAGPLCDEPMWGLGFCVEAYVTQSDVLSEQIDQYGQVMMAVKEACRAAVLQRKPRLVEAMYYCELSAPVEELGSMFSVLSKRRAQVLKDEMQEGSALFSVQAYVPVSESFGFVDELRASTSGAASALLVLSHWETLPQDPFFVPKTEEEMEEFGDGSSVPPNMARRLIDTVRRRKGLPVEEKVVQHATKQRTRARKV
ncbi:hypothetical protein QJS04_geneDACA009406 [Acorus gramineus]|uniref:Elongation factor-like 1 n=1 Tax=Acorus gramineus TaxID=55184 RepID=A0AAV9AFJ6_ACOGR|nr:hypothetical protein QJS04_geneDACA009406 [Acorus gramineus]